MSARNRIWSPEGLITSIRQYANRQPSNNVTYSASTNWPTANKAFFAIVRIVEPVILTKAYWHNGSNVAGNVDVGIYDAATLKKVWSSGTVSQSGINTRQSVTITGGVAVIPGLYYIAMASDTATNHRVIQASYSNAVNSSMVGVFEQASAFNLPDPAVPVTTTGGFLRPIMGFVTALAPY